MLLPSKALKKLHQRVPICLSGKELPANCDLRYGQFYYFFLFNAEGELTHVGNMSNGLTDRLNQGISLPHAFVDMVEDALKIKTSLDDREHAYLEERGSEQAFTHLQDKLKQMERIGTMRVVHRLRENATRMQSPTLTRYHALSLEIEAVRRQVINKNAIDSLAGSIESFLSDNPDFSDSRQLIDAYIEVALRYCFDLSEQCKIVAGQWQNNATDEQRSAAEKLGNQLLERCNQHLVSVRKDIKKLESDRSYDAPRLYAQIGNASKTLELIKKTTSIGVLRPIHQAWREAANLKLQK